MPPRERLSPKKTVGFLRRLTPRIRPYRFALVGAAVLMLMSTGVGLAFPLIVRELLDAAFLANDSGLLNRVALGLLGLFGVQAVVNFGQSYLTASVSERVVADLRRDLFSSLVHQPPGFFASRRVGELTSCLASDSGLIQGVLRFGVPEIIRQGIFLVGALVLVTITNPRLTLVTLTAIPFAALVGWYFGRRVRHMSTHIQDRLADAVSRAEQVFTQIRTVQSFTREGYEAKAYETEVNRARDEGLRRAVARASLTGAVTFAAFGAIVVVLWEGGRLVLAGALTPGTHPGGLSAVRRDHLRGDHVVGRLLGESPGGRRRRQAYLRALGSSSDHRVAPRSETAPPPDPWGGSLRRGRLPLRAGSTTRPGRDRPHAGGWRDRGSGGQLWGGQEHPRFIDPPLFRRGRGLRVVGRGRRARAIPPRTQK